MSSASYPPQLPGPLVEKAVRDALSEDLGLAGDLTSQAVLSPDMTAVAVMNARDAGVICGFDLAEAAFRQIGQGVALTRLVAEGAHVGPKTDIARIEGPARLVMSAERVALNFMTHMCGIATYTRTFVEAIAGTGAEVCDTRKTTPGLRAFEKYAVRCGGGSNHRYGLDDAILIKDNHIAVAGGVREAIEAARAFAGHLVAIEIEVDRLDQLAQALEAGATAVLLDNMGPDTLREAVAMTGGRAKLEASGGVTLESIRAIAETGVDYISTSRITMAAVPLDLGLDVKIS